MNLRAWMGIRVLWFFLSTSVFGQNVSELRPGVPVQGTLSAGEVHNYDLYLADGEFARLSVEQAEWRNTARLVVVIDSPEGSRIEIPSPTMLRFPVWLLAQSGGRYRVQIRLMRVQSVHYTLCVEEGHRATESDRVRFAASQALLEANRLIAGTFSNPDQGQAQPSTDDLKRAAEKYQEATALFGSTEDRLGVACVLMNMAPFKIFQPDLEKKIVYLEQARTLWQALGQRDMEANTLMQMAGFLHVGLSRAREALALYAEALAIWQGLGNEAEAAGVLGQLADAHRVLGEFGDALTLESQALAIYRSLHSPQEEIALMQMAMICESLRDHECVLDYDYQALRRAQAAGNRVREAVNLINIAAEHAGAGELGDAVESTLRALEIYRELGDRDAEISALGHLGGFYLQRGETDRALQNFNQVLEYQRSVTHNRVQQAMVLEELAGAYRQKGELDKALKSLLEALPLFTISNETHFGFLHGIASLYWEMGNREKALEYYNRMLSESREVHNIQSEASALTGIGRIEQAIGQLDQARSHIEEALEQLESLRALLPGPEARSSYFSRVRDTYELYTDLLMQMHSSNPGKGYDAEALRSAEMARSRGLLEMLAEARVDFRQGVDPKLLEREREMGARLNAAAGRQTQLLGGRHSEAQAAEAAKAVRDLGAEYRLLQAQIHSTSPRYASLTQPEPLDLRQIQSQVLDKDSVLLEYALGDKRSFLWAVTPDSIVSFELPGRSEIDTAARLLYKLLTVRNEHPKGETTHQRRSRLARSDAQRPEAAARLSRILLAPAAKLLEEKRLVVVGDGMLQYIPFASLPDPASLDAKKGHSIALLARHEIVCLPSASVAAMLRHDGEGRTSPRKGVAVLADPVFDKDDPRVHGTESASLQKAGKRDPSPTGLDRALSAVGLGEAGSRLPRLPFSRREAESIVAVSGDEPAWRAVDFEASRETATSSRLAQYRIIHFATHGLLNSEAPELSGIVLSLVDPSGKPKDGFLRLHDIYNLDLPADLVVLSACRTALGKELKGEGLIGLTRGFMYAGAARVVASLWNVDDSATAGLMSRFYRSMLVEGKRPAAALRAAQLELSRSNRWHDPYFWAAFELQGEWK